MTGSENHDLNFKAGALISPKIFMELPEYKDRIYPDSGRGGSSGGTGSTRAATTGMRSAAHSKAMARMTKAPKGAATSRTASNIMP
ncbi:MAG: hypothetical protein ACOX8S_08790 [Christensenellales bacterium]|jgi:hypothetical protein